MDVALKLADLEEVPEDSAIYVSGDNIRKALFGIDAGVSELMLAKQLGYDAVIAHHPPGGRALVNFPQVFKRHIQQMVSAGVPIEEARKAIRRKFETLRVEACTRNYTHATDVARLLGIPYLNIHTPLDEIGRKRMDMQIRKEVKDDFRVREIISALKELPEFQNALTDIKIAIGKPENLAGKIVVSHGAGTNGGYEIAKTYFKYGVGTLIYIHINPWDLEKLKTEIIEGKNLIVTGHIASDSVGINPFIRKLENRGVHVTTIGVVKG
jgi:hypothetical protein